MVLQLIKNVLQTAKTPESFTNTHSAPNNFADATKSFYNAKTPGAKTSIPQSSDTFAKYPPAPLFGVVTFAGFTVVVVTLAIAGLTLDIVVVTSLCGSVIVVCVDAICRSRNTKKTTLAFELNILHANLQTSWSTRSGVRPAASRDCMWCKALRSVDAR